MDILIIILSILNIIGFILLYAFLIVMVLMVFILFMPIKYCIYGEKKENNDIILKATFSWFFKALTCCYCYDNKNNPRLILKVFGFTVVGNNKKNNKESIGKDLKEEKEDKEDFKRQLSKNENKPKEDPVNDLNTDKSTQEEGESEKENHSYEDTFKAVVSKIELTIEKIREIYDYPQRKEIQKLTIDFVKKILKVIKPKTFKLNGEVGFESPDITGYCMAATSFLLFTGLNINLKGNFEKKIFIMDLKATGKFNLWALIWPTGKYILKRPIRNLIKQLI